MKQGAIFDLDGTMVDTMALHEKAWESVLSRRAIPFAKEERAAHRGRKDTAFASFVLEKNGIRGVAPEDIAEEKRRCVMDILEKEPSHAFPGLLLLLSSLKKRGIVLALATSSPKELALLLGKETVPFFEVRVFSEDVEKGKPDPQAFFAAAERLSLSPKDCVVFEDAESGIAAAKKGGFFCVARDNKEGQDLSSADLVVETWEGKDREDILSLFE